MTELKRGRVDDIVMVRRAVHLEDGAPTSERCDVIYRSGMFEIITPEQYELMAGTPGTITKQREAGKSTG